MNLIMGACGAALNGQGTWRVAGVREKVLAGVRLEMVRTEEVDNVLANSSGW